MWGLAAVIIPIACCLLIAVVVAVAAFTGLGKKKLNDKVRNGELPQEILSQSTQLLEREEKTPGGA